MNIAKFCIKHKVTTLLAAVMLVIFGAVFTTRLQLALLPDMEAPMAVVMCYYNGATPSDMEELVTRPLESAVMSVPGVEGVSSTSSEGVSQLQITYVEDTDLDIAAAKLREKFDMLSLPDGAIDPIIVNMNLSDMLPSAMVALIGDDLAKLQHTAEQVVSPALERIDGVASVSISGGVTNQIAVEVDQARASALGLSGSYISQMLAAENLLFPGGELQNGQKTLTVSTDAKFRSVSEVENLLIALPTGGTVRLGEVANVVLETKTSDTTAKVDGTACVLLQVSKQSGANEVATADAVAERMEELRAENPSIRYSIPYLASDYINLAVDSAFQNIYMGVALAAVVVFLFLRRLGATLTIAVSMPVCILTVFVLMNVFDLTLNMMSLGGIAMGVGMIVDNSIVVLENIYRYASEGHDRMTACVEGTKEVITSLMASTLTTVAVFLPLGLSGGLAGMIFKDFCLTIAFLILASLVISVTLVPLLCYFLLDEEKVRRQQMKKSAKREKTGLTDRMYRAYEKVLAFFTRHLAAGMALTIALVVLFGAACLNTKMVLLPAMDQGMVAVTVSTPTGSEPEETMAITDRIVAVAQKEIPELRDLYYTSQAESASITFNLIDKTQRERTSDEVADHLRTRLQDIAGCELTVTASDMSAMMGGSDISVAILGDDYDTLGLIAGELAAEIAALPDAVEVTSSLSRQVPQVKVTMKRDLAAQYGLTAATVGAAVRSELTGSTATTVTIDNRELDVVVRGDGAAGKSLDALRSMPVPTPLGGYVPLGTVADVTVEQAPKSITRVDQSRRVTVSGSTLSGDVTAITEEIQAILDRYPMPEGYQAQIGGAYTDMMENFSDLGLALIVALGLVYFILASQFESFFMPVIVMLILPIAFTGALVALPLTGRDLSMISMVALIMLAGTVVNSSIILVDYINVRRERGESREEAMLKACPLRVRPVLMTTLTTILALVPMAMGIGQTNEMISDMGITMISGMLISTIITLLFTPVFYCVIDNFTGLFRRKKKAVAAE